MAERAWELTVHMWDVMFVLRFDSLKPPVIEDPDQGFTCLLPVGLWDSCDLTKAPGQVRR